MTHQQRDRPVLHGTGQHRRLCGVDLQAGVHCQQQKALDFIENSYDSLDANLDAWIKNTLLPSMQNILSGAAVGVVNVVTWIKNFIIGLIVSVYLLASRKKFGQRGQAHPL